MPSTSEQRKPGTGVGKVWLGRDPHSQPPASDWAGKASAGWDRLELLHPRPDFSADVPSGDLERPLVPKSCFTHSSSPTPPAPSGPGCSQEQLSARAKEGVCVRFPYHPVAVQSVESKTSSEGPEPNPSSESPQMILQKFGIRAKCCFLNHSCME